MQMTFLAILKKDNNEVSFERFGCKRATTVKRQMIKLSQNNFYRACMEGANTIEVYATPDGYTKEKNPCLVFSV